MSKASDPARAAMLEAKGLVTVEDLLGYVPFRYEDRSNMKTIAQLAPGEMATVIAEVQIRQAVRLQTPQSRDCSKRSSPIAPRAILVGKWFHGGYLAERCSPGHEGGAVRQSGVRQLLRRPDDAASRSSRFCRATMRATRRCTWAASCRSTKPPARSPRACSATLMHRILESLRAGRRSAAAAILRDG